MKVSLIADSLKYKYYAIVFCFLIYRFLSEYVFSSDIFLKFVVSKFINVSYDFSHRILLR